MKHLKANPFLAILIFFFLCVCFFMAFIIAPRRFGDSTEYIFTLESFYNHGSFEQRTHDADKILELVKTNDNSEYEFLSENRYSGYFEGIDGNLYSYHFWGYSLANWPIKIMFKILGLNELSVFQVTNSIFLALAVSLFYFLTRRLKFSKLITLALIFNPIIFYISFPHPEVYTYSLIVLSFGFLLHRNFFIAALLASIASTQNPPLLVLAGFFALIGILHKKNFRKLNGIYIKKIFFDFCSFSFSLLPAIIPYIFYYIFFKTPNLISSVGGTDFKLISAKRIFELFFDPNIGMFFYLPVLSVLAFIFTGISIYKIALFLFKKRGEIKSDFLIAGLFVVLVLMLALSASTQNWNHGMIGPSRYALWSIIPIFIIIVLLGIQKIKAKRLLDILLILNLLVSLIVVFYAGFITPNGRFGPAGMNPQSRLILNLIPSSYNPSPEIFKGRVLCNSGDKDIVCEYPIIYREEKIGECKKALIRNLDEDKKRLKELCGKDFKIDTCLENNLCYASF